jgi:PAS domain S-box-containing protein
MPPDDPKRSHPTADFLPGEEMFKLLVDSMHEYAIFLLDVNGNVASWNKAAHRLKGYAAEEIVGRHFSTFYPDDMPRDAINAELDIALRDGVFRDEGWRVRKDGTQFWADVTITPVRDAAGTLRGFAKVTRDMTARRRAEEQRGQLYREQAARAEAERANQLKDAFLATLSHELRTPLNAIVGWTHLLQASDLGPEARRGVEVIARNAAAQTKLISDILDISRISTGRVHLRVQPVAMEQVINAAVDAVSPAASAKGIRVTRLLSTDVGPVSGDPDRLQQVVWNLLSNAVKFTPKGGRVEVRLQRVSSHLDITVQDSGMGVAPEFLPYVFEPFRQADPTPSRAHGGLGLGLAIVRHLVELHGGRVYVTSPGPGQGATFTVELPALAVSAGLEERGEAAPLPAGPTLHGTVVLLVEDDADSRQIAQRMLQDAGARVLAAATVGDGLALMREERPHVVVTDIEMPGESGYDLIRKVRALPFDSGGLTPAIALTAYARTEDRIRSLAAGFQMHLAKPVHPSELTAAVAAVTARGRS